MTIENQIPKEQPTTTNASTSDYYNTYDQFSINKVAAMTASNAAAAVAAAASSRSVPGSRRNSNDERR